jgi:Kef-type K+ transport system membrane component KefB/CBS domain-containing protein
MTALAPASLALAEPTHVPILLVIGLAVFIGTVGARLFQWLRIPQVVGYILIGLVLGESALGVIRPEAIRSLLPANFFALGVIGFMIGGELHREVFRQHGRALFKILFSEGLTTFLVVAVGVGAVAQCFWHDWAQSAALALVLGAIASATAPAATVDVLWEYKARGLLTTTVFAIVALDDGLALVLFSLASSGAKVLTGGGVNVWASLGRTAWELLGAAAMGVAGGFVLNYLIRRFRDRDKTLSLILGMLALVLGGAIFLEMDVILAAMALGVTIANLAPRRTNQAFAVVESFAPPIYALFFVFVGARLTVEHMPWWMLAVAVAYVLGRTGGKMLGARLGARWAGLTGPVRRYLGLCLFSQAGVAIGLAILAGGRFEGPIGTAVVTIVTATTFLVQILGPPCVKHAVVKAGEAGLNVTEEDLAREYTVGDALLKDTPAFPEHALLGQILRTLARTEASAYPVVDEQGRLTGMISLQQLRQSFMSEGLTDWLVAHDVMEPVHRTLTRTASLEEALLEMREEGLEYLPVVESDSQASLAGMIELRAAERMLSAEVLRRRRQADSFAVEGAGT